MYCYKNHITLSSSMLFRTKDEIDEIIKLCDENNITCYDGMFKRKKEEILQIVELCQKYSIPITDSCFRKNSHDFENIVKTCIELGILPKGSVFKRTPEEIREINHITMEYLGEKPTQNTFVKKPEEVKKIIEVCLNYHVPITGIVYQKNASELEDSILFVKEQYGEDYLIPQIIIYDKEHLNRMFSYFKGKRYLPYLKKSTSILKLTLNEIIERESYLREIGESIITNNGTFHPIFGVIKKEFLKRKNGLIEEKSRRVYG